MEQSLRALLARPQISMTEASEMIRSIDACLKPAAGSWIVGRVATLLMGYSAFDRDPAAERMIAHDWLAELRGLPEWALTAAVRHWQGRDNPKRGIRPQPGDISALAHDLVRNLRAGPDLLARKARVPVAPSRAPVAKAEASMRRERAEQILKEVWRDEAIQ